MYGIYVHTDSYVYTQDIEYVCIIQSADQFFQMERFEIYEALTYGKPSVTSVCDDMPASFVVMFIGEGRHGRTENWHLEYSIHHG